MEQKIIAFSDSHGDGGVLVEIIEKEQDVAAFFHAGDGLEEAKQMQKLHPKKRFFPVAGNCDWGRSYEESVSTKIGGIQIFLTHGHLFRAKAGLQELLGAGRRAGAQLVIYGHTHIPKEDHLLGVTLVNPGSCARMQGNQPCYAQIFIKNGQIRTVFRQLGGWE